MYQALMYPRVTRVFHPHGERYHCKFREHGQEGFIEDGAFDNLDVAMSFTSLVVRFVDQVAEGQVFDKKQGQLVFTCHSFVPNPAGFVLKVREVPAEYAQLAMQGFDLQEVRKAAGKQRKKVQETLLRLRQLHEELNSQLVANPTERPTIHSPSDAASILMCFIGNLDHVEFWVIDLDTRNRVMQLVALYKGSVNSSQVRVAEVFRQAILDNAPSIVIAHNHPSGDPSPSPDDVAVTHSIVQAGKLLDIEVLDHIVVARSGYVSLKERGLGFS
jgi:DNA repair protein RadC